MIGMLSFPVKGLVLLNSTAYLEGNDQLYVNILFHAHFLSLLTSFAWSSMTKTYSNGTCAIYK